MNKKVVGKKSNIGIIRRSIGVGETRKSVGGSHSRARNVSKVKIEVLQEHHPSCLSARQLLWLVEVCEIFMVGEEGYWVDHALEIVSPMIQGVDNSKEFPIINVIISFCRSEHLRKIGTGVKVSVIILLHEDSSTSQEGSISHNDEGTMDIWEAEYQSCLKFG